MFLNIYIRMIKIKVIIENDTHSNGMEPNTVQISNLYF